MTEITIYHNPRCSKSRQTLNLLQEKGLEPTIVLYLETPPDIDTLRNIVRMLDAPLIDIVRKGETAFRPEMLEWSEDKLLAEMVKNPILLERPIVVAGGNARIGRPPESILDIL
ncbi:MAG: arsenate reductase [Candidatus Azotimanducaceae bacterium]|jgi:arsenate reductase